MRVFLAVVVSLMLGALAWPVRFTWEVGAGEVLWNSHEADIFIQVVRRGWEGNGLRWLFAAAQNAVGRPTNPDAKRESGLVLRLTGSTVEEYQVDSSLTESNTVFEGRIHAGPEWRWVGNHFEHADLDEQRRFSAAKAFSGQFSNLDGWSRRCCLFYSFASTHGIYLELEHHSFVLTARGIEGGQALDLQAVGEASSRRIWSMDNRNHRVSSAEYSQLFDLPSS